MPVHLGREFKYTYDIEEFDDTGDATRFMNVMAQDDYELVDILPFIGIGDTPMFLLTIRKKNYIVPSDSDGDESLADYEIDRIAMEAPFQLTPEAILNLQGGD